MLRRGGACAYLCVPTRFPPRKLTSVDSSHVELDIDVSMLGTHLHCPSEEFQLAPSGAVTLPKDSDPSDCPQAFVVRSLIDGRAWLGVRGSWPLS